MKDSRLSYSALKAFAKSPNHFIHYKTKPQPDAQHFAFGRATHGYILERDKFEDQFLIMPKVDRRTKAGKEQYAELMSNAGERQLVDESDMATIKAMTYAVNESGNAMQLLSNTQRELHKEGDIQGVPFHGYADAVNDQYAIDLKTCRDASPGAFMRDAHNLDYHLQAAVYRALFNVDRFYWIAVEKEAPHNVTVYMQSADAAQKSDFYLSELIKKWKAWDGNPKSYSDFILNLNLPKWA